MTAIPGGTSTYSKIRFPGPVRRAAWGSGCWIGTDDRRYIDTVAGLGCISLGYRDERVDAAITKQMEYGISFSLPTGFEENVAQHLLRFLNWGERVRFSKNGADVTNLAVRLARAHTARDGIVACYTPDTEILTYDRGFVGVTELKVGELVATLNPTTEELEYHPIERTTQREYNGNLVHFKGKRIDLLVTEDHNVLRGFKQINGEIVWRHVRAGDLVGKAAQTLMTAGCQWKGMNHAMVDIASQRYVNPSSRSDRRRGHPTKGVTRFDSKAFFRFMGYYVSEGSCSAYPEFRKQKSYTVQLTQNPGPVRDKMHEVLSAMGFRPINHGHHLVVNSKELWTVVYPLGHAKAKHIPPWMKQAAPSLLRELFEAMIEGDGSRRGKYRMYYTSSRRLADDAAEIGLKLGWASTMRAETNHGFSQRNNDDKRESIIYHVGFSRHTVKWLRSPKLESYRGMVHCLTVRNHTVLARRNGKTVWCGNCDYHGHDDWCQVRSLDQNAGIPHVVGELVRDTLGDLNPSMDVTYPLTPAALILEPVPSDGSTRTTEDLEHYANWCKEHGALLIYDCMITGMRLNRRGWPDDAPEPDLACYGKAMGNGMPLSALVGPEYLMDRITDDVFFSTTFGGECLSLAAADAVLTVYEEQDVLERFREAGLRLSMSLTKKAEGRELGRSELTFASYASRPFHKWRTKEQADTFTEAMLEEGILYQGYHNLMLASCEDEPLAIIERAYDVALAKVAAL